jgi:hypothetical protein
MYRQLCKIILHFIICKIILLSAGDNRRALKEARVLMQSKLILPSLPGNLERMRQEEDSIRASALLHINADVALKDRIALVHDSLDAVFTYTHDHKNLDDDELVLQRLGIRLFNSGACALSLLPSGYYQNSALQLRDLLETGFLIDYFRTEPAKIKVWQNSNDQERQKLFGPKVIREALDRRDEFSEGNRAKAYKVLSNYSAHPTHAGFKLFSPNWMSKITPFFDGTYTKAMVEKLVKHFAGAAEVYVKSFPRIAPELDLVRRQYFEDLGRWCSIYMINGLPSQTASS